MNIIYRNSCTLELQEWQARLTRTENTRMPARWDWKIPAVAQAGCRMYRHTSLVQGKPQSFDFCFVIRCFHSYSHALSTSLEYFRDCRTCHLLVSLLFLHLVRLLLPSKGQLSWRKGALDSKACNSYSMSDHLCRKKKILSCT